MVPGLMIASVCTRYIHPNADEQQTLCWAMNGGSQLNVAAAAAAATAQQLLLYNEQAAIIIHAK